MSRIDDAVDRYKGINGKNKENCTLSIIKTFNDYINITDEELVNYQRYGGGRAPEGVCGAYYAADRLFQESDSEDMDKLREAFEKEAGSLKCREIRKMGKLSCDGCVRKIAELLERKFPIKK